MTLRRYLLDVLHAKLAKLPKDSQEAEDLRQRIADLEKE